MCDGSACPDAETPVGHDMPCMVMHHESYMHIMIISYDDESLGGAQGKRGKRGKGDSGRGLRNGEARA